MKFIFILILELSVFSLKAQTYYDFEIKGIVTDIPMVPLENYPVLIYKLDDAEDTLGTFYTNTSGAFSTTTPVLKNNADRRFAIELIDCNGTKIIKYVQSNQGTSPSGTANFSICPGSLTSVSAFQESLYHEKRSPLQFFPNPSSSGQFYYMENDFNHLHITFEDIFGRQIPAFLNSDGVVDLSHFPKGIYFAKCIFKGQSNQAKLIVE